MGHATTAVYMRSSAQATKRARMSSGAAEESRTGSTPSSANPPRHALEALLVLVLPRVGFRLGQAHLVNAHQWPDLQTESQSRRRAGKLCSHTGSWITTGTTSHRCASAAKPRVRRRWRQEVRQDEHERPLRQGEVVGDELLESSLDSVLRRREPPVLEPLVDRREDSPLALRPAPVGLLAGEVEVPDERMDARRAFLDQQGGGTHRRAASRARGTAAGRAPSQGGDRRRSPRAALPRHSARGR